MLAIQFMQESLDSGTKIRSCWLGSVQVHVADALDAGSVPHAQQTNLAESREGGNVGFHAQAKKSPFCREEMPFQDLGSLADELHFRTLGGNLATEIFLAHPIALIAGVLGKQKLHEVFRIVPKLTAPPRAEDDFLRVPWHDHGDRTEKEACKQKSQGMNLPLHKALKLHRHPFSFSFSPDEEMSGVLGK